MVNLKSVFKSSIILLMAIATLAIAGGYDKGKADGSMESHQHKTTGWNEMKSEEPMLVEVDIEYDNLDPFQRQEAKNILEVAVMGSRDFDVNTIDQTTLAIGEVKGNGEFLVIDRNNDGMDDLIAEFSTDDLKLKEGVQKLTLKGQTKDGKLFEGSDQITVTKAN